MKSDRLFGIIYLLLMRECVTAKELADYFEVSVRTIYRDIELLSSYSIPIYTEQGRYGGIHLMDSYQLDKTVLREEEQKQILFALQSLEKLSSNQYSISDKLQWLFQQDSRSFIDVDFSIWGKSPIDMVVFNSIQKAILSSNVVQFTYYNSLGTKTNRRVEPLQLCFRYNAWYLYGYDTDKKDYRLFKLLRIQSMTITADTFQREIPETDLYPKEEHIQRVTLKVHQNLAYRVYDEFEASCITTLEDGNFLVRVDYPENEWLYGYILSFGSGATVLEPDSIREIVKEKLEKALQNYL